jgi:hypothetical protein
MLGYIADSNASALSAENDHITTFFEASLLPIGDI